MALLAVPDASRKYEISETRIRELLRQGTVKGRKFGPTWAVDERSLQRYASSPEKRKRGPKTKRRA